MPLISPSLSRRLNVACVFFLPPLLLPPPGPSYLYRLHLSGKVEGSGYGLQNEGAPLMTAGYMAAGTGGREWGVSGEMGADRKERLYLCLEFGC